MSLGVFFAILLAALLHASWNALIKTSQNRMTGMLVLVLGDAAIGVVVVAGRALPPPEVWPWLIASGLIRTAYQLFLVYAYQHGDLSRVYPIARGTAPLLVLLAGALVLSDVITPLEVAGILVLGLGILLMAHGVFSNGESRRLVPFALGSAAATAGYTLVDGLGARISGDPFVYVGWALIVTTLMFVPSIIMLRGPVIFRASPRVWLSGALAGAASYLAYSIVVWAMTLAPIALVAALRETSILFAVLIGWLVVGEKVNRSKALAAVLIVAGAALTRI